MKNLTRLTTKEEIHEYVGSLWRTSHFKKSHEVEKGYIRGIVEDLAERPVVFFDMNQPSIEWSQFTTWMGAYALRPDYDNDTVHDLYYLHEFVHGATMEYDPDLSFTAWHRKMCENEMLASMHSEAYVYFMLEGLRAQSFDFEIWADRYLAKPGLLHPYGFSMTSWRHTGGNTTTSGYNYRNLKEALRRASLRFDDDAGPLRFSGDAAPLLCHAKCTVVEYLEGQLPGSRAPHG